MYSSQEVHEDHMSDAGAVITHETDPPFIPRAGRRCICQFCGFTAKCTPTCDFYSNGNPGGPLACEICMRRGKVAT